MYKKKQAQTVFDQINITPLTDVFLVLLVVLMLITPIMDESMLKVSSPGNGDNCKSKATQIVVDIDALGQMKLNGQLMRFTDSLYLQRQLQRIKEKSSNKEFAVLIRPDELSKHKDVVAVMDAATGAGIIQVGVLAVNKSSARTN